MSEERTQEIAKPRRILYIGAECKPFSMVGGVGDVVGEMPVALKKAGHDVQIVTPGYSCIDAKHVVSTPGDATEQVDFKVVGDSRLGDVEARTVKYRSGTLGGVPVHFAVNDTYFGTRVDPRYGKPYVDSRDLPFKDDAIRFSFFAQAVLPLIKRHKPDIVHVNDWAMGYLLGWMKLNGQLDAKGGPATVLTIHNVGYQGNMPRGLIGGWDMEELANDPLTAAPFADPRAGWHNVNPLRLAMELADVTNTVSPNYMREMTRPEDQSRFFEGGKGLEGIAQKLDQERRLFGILNGIQYKIAQPSDADFEAIMKEKVEMRRRFAAYFKQPDGFLVGFVGRCVTQKFGLLAERLGERTVLEHILDIPGVNVAFLATGDPQYESFMANVGAVRFEGSRGYGDMLCVGRRGNYVSTVAFDKDRARQTWLASDIFLMPSLFEPCGITQMQSMELATPPLVRGTGGLLDTVVDYSQPDSTGFVCDGATREEVLRSIIDAVLKAKDVKENRADEFRAMQRRAFDQRFTWEKALPKYEALYEKALARRALR
jgi:starch synthase